MIHPLLIFLLISALAVALYGMFYFFVLYCREIRRHDKFRNKIERKYIPVTVELRNAVIEAYDNAQKKHNDFELKAYRKLVDDVKSRW